MIKWLLMCFSAHRDLLKMLAESRERALELQGRNAELMRRCDAAEERAQHAEKSEREWARMTANLHVQRTYGFTPFPDSPSIPEAEIDRVLKAGPSGTTNARRVQQAEYDAFAEQLRELVSK